jgi:hypothetical protein
LIGKLEEILKTEKKLYAYLKIFSFFSLFEPNSSTKQENYFTPMD